MAMKQLNAARVKAHNPDIVAMVSGHQFYEHPLLGDESILFIETPTGNMYRTDFWEAPEAAELAEWLTTHSNVR